MSDTEKTEAAVGVGSPPPEDKGVSSQADDSARLCLPENFVRDSVAGVATFVTANIGNPIFLDGSSMRQCGAQGAQVLAMAAATWASEGLSFVVTDPSGALRDCLSQLGMGHLIAIQKDGDVIT